MYNSILQKVHLMSLSRSRVDRYRKSANTLFAAKNYSEAARHYEQAILNSRATQRPHEFYKAINYSKWAECELALQRYSNAVDLANIAINLFNQSRDDSPAKSHLDDKCRNIIAQAQAALMNLPIEGIPALPQNHYDYAKEGTRQLTSLNNVKLAAEYYEKAIEDIERSVNNENLNIAKAKYYHHLASCELQLKNYEKAESLAKTSFDIFIKIKTPNVRIKSMQDKNIRFVLEAGGKKLRNRVFELPSLPVEKISEIYSLPFVKHSKADVHYGTLFSAQTVPAKTCNNATFNVHGNADGSVTIDRVTPTNKS